MFLVPNPAQILLPTTCEPPRIHARRTQPKTACFMDDAGFNRESGVQFRGQSGSNSWVNLGVVQGKIWAGGSRAAGGRCAPRHRCRRCRLAACHQPGAARQHQRLRSAQPWTAASAAQGQTEQHMRYKVRACIVFCCEVRRPSELA